jgi:hypothetical protein
MSLYPRKVWCKNSAFCFVFFASPQFVLGIALIVSVLSHAYAQAPTLGDSGPLTVTQVVDRMIAANTARAQALESYQGTRTYTLNYKGFPADLQAQMVVNMTYTAPSTKNFVVVSRTGPKWIQDQVMSRLLKTEKDAQQGKNRKNVDLNTENYNFSNLEYHPAADHCSYRLFVAPKSPSKYLYRGKIWINDHDFAVCRIEVQPARNPSFWIKSTNISHSYEKIGDFWLPQRNQSSSTMRFGGHAALTIQYQDYKIVAAKAVVNRSSSLASNRSGH